MNDSINRWFDFVEKYYRQSSVPLSWALIPKPQLTSCRLAGTPIGMTTLSKREWNKIVGDDNVPRRHLPKEVTPTGGKE